MAHELPQETRETIDQLIASPGANVLDVRLEEPLFMAWWDLVGQVLGKLLHFLWAELFERGFTPPDQVANSTGLVDTFGCRTNPATDCGLARSASRNTRTPPKPSFPTANMRSSCTRTMCSTARTPKPSPADPSRRARPARTV